MVYVASRRSGGGNALGGNMATPLIQVKPVFIAAILTGLTKI
jgi:hypothetical protein